MEPYDSLPYSKHTATGLYPSQMNLFHKLPLYFYKIYCNIFRLTMLCFLCGTFILDFLKKT